MAEAISIHIGVRNGRGKRCSRRTLDGPVNDACAMAELASSRGFRDVMLLESKATCAAVTRELEVAAGDLNEGGILLLTYSGHGSQIVGSPGRRREDGERYDETWCLADGALVDDQLRTIWPTFNPGVRIVVVSDSCKSGSIHSFTESGELEPMSKEEVERWRSTLSLREEEKRLLECADVEWNAMEKLLLPRRIPDGEIGASLLLLAACREGENAEAGCPHSLFTQILLEELGRERDRSYAALMLDVRGRVAHESMGSQHPGIALAGPAGGALLCERAFKP